MFDGIVIASSKNTYAVCITSSFSVPGKFIILFINSLFYQIILGFRNLAVVRVASSVGKADN